MSDWGTGRYELTAAELEPAARHVVELAAVEPGERVLDIGCGTGNAALLAARAGGVVTGLDPAPRLLEVAGSRAREEGLEVAFEQGVAGELPLPDASFDVALSVFAVIFAPSAGGALAEAMRALRPEGRLLISAWVPEGGVDEALSVLGRATEEATGEARRERFPWHDVGAVRELAAGYGADVGMTEGEIAFTADSPEAFLAEGGEHHPMFLAARALLEEAGTWEATRAEALAGLIAANEDPEAFRVTGRYRVGRITRPA